MTAPLAVKPSRVGLKHRTPAQIALDVQRQAKVCRACGEMKPFAEFTRQKASPDGHEGKCKACHVAHSREHTLAWQARDPEGFQRSRRLTNAALRFGVTREEVAAVLEASEYACAICGTPVRDKARPGDKARACIDHDHETGRIRGVLCDPCNNGLGRFEDDPERLIAAAHYLLRFRRQEGGESHPDQRR